MENDYLRKLAVKALLCTTVTICLIAVSDAALHGVGNATAISQMATGVNVHYYATTVAQFISNNLTALSVGIWLIAFAKDIVKGVRYIKGGCK